MTEARAASYDLIRTYPANTPVFQGTGMPIANSQVPTNVTMTMPQFVSSANDVAANPQPALTPADLLHPLPSIVNTAPVDLAPACSGMTSWIDKNPIFAVGVLGVLAYVVWGMGGEGRK